MEHRIREEDRIGRSVRPYVLAGGQSSRMGRDKAMLRLAGRTLLGRAVDMLRGVPALQDESGNVVVTIVGERTSLEGADRIIPDRYARCGPLGGIEAALGDLNASGKPDWALFVPVDMPFLPAGLIDALLQEWMVAAQKGARVCWVEVDGRIQPLISLVHRSLHLFAVEALTAGVFKVTPVLQAAVESLAVPSLQELGFRHHRVHKTHVERSGHESPIAGWNAIGEQERLKRLWFSNLNSEEEFREAETFLAGPG